MSKVYIYLFENTDKLDDNFVVDNLYKLPAFRQEQCNRYRQEADKKACILSYLLLEKGLRKKYGIDRPVSFIYNEYGKPYLKEYPHIFFNISHCKSGVVCALADAEIGVDIQDVRPFDIDVARRVCSENELRLLSESDNPARLFCKMWTEKESHAKARGIGVAGVLKCDLAREGFKSFESDNYCITLSVKDDCICDYEVIYEIK